MLKTSTGEYINAVLIEQELTKSNYIDYAVIIANDRKYVSALLFVNQDVTKEVDAETFYASKSIQELIQKHVDSVNYDLNKWEKVVKYSLITQKISIDTGELTPSMKIRKNEVEKLYHPIIETMY